MEPDTNFGLEAIPFSDAVLISKDGQHFPIHRIIIYAVEHLANMLKFEGDKPQYTFPYTSIATQHILKWVYKFHYKFMLGVPSDISSTQDLIDLLRFRMLVPEFQPDVSWSNLPMAVVTGLDEDNLGVLISHLGVYSASHHMTEAQQYCMSLRPQETKFANNSKTMFMLIERGVVLKLTSVAGNYAANHWIDYSHWKCEHASFWLTMTLCCEPDLIAAIHGTNKWPPLPRDFNWTGICDIVLWSSTGYRSIPADIPVIVSVKDRLLSYGYLDIAKYWLVAAMVTKFKYLGAIAGLLKDQQIPDPDHALLTKTMQAPIVMPKDKLLMLFDKTDIDQWMKIWDTMPTANTN